jgi:hypothetical protein
MNLEMKSQCNWRARKQQPVKRIHFGEWELKWHTLVPLMHQIDGQHSAVFLKRKWMKVWYIPKSKMTVSHNHNSLLNLDTWKGSLKWKISLWLARSKPSEIALPVTQVPVLRLHRFFLTYHKIIKLTIIIITSINVNIKCFIASF